MDTPIFPSVDAEVLAEKIHSLPAAGRLIAPKSSIECCMCRRKIGALGRLPFPGMPTCDSAACQLTRPGAITELFPGAYGRTLTRGMLEIFCQVLELPSGRILIQRDPIIARSEILASGQKRLIRWQEVFDIWSRHEEPDEYEQGKVRELPPKNLEDVMAVRAMGMPVMIDPLRHMSESLQLKLRRIYKDGVAAIELPF